MLLEYLFALCQCGQVYQDVTIKATRTQQSLESEREGGRKSIKENKLCGISTHLVQYIGSIRAGQHENALFGGHAVHFD